jgi:hypothetical protein
MSAQLRIAAACGALVVTLTAGLWVPPTGSADNGFNLTSYSWDRSCSHFIDPIGVVFYGRGAGGEYLPGQWYKNPPRKGHIYYHTGWGRHSGEGTQYFKYVEGCYSNIDVQPAEAAPFPNSRYHMRLFPLDDYAGGPYLLGTPHHEDWVLRCPGHAVDMGSSDPDHPVRTDNGSGFDRGRRKLAIRFGKGRHRHRVTSHHWGNTKARMQCDGEYAGSNGNVAWIKVG